MPEAKLKVKLLAVTPQALDVIYSAFRQCYSPKYAADILRETRNIWTADVSLPSSTWEKIEKILQQRTREISLLA